MKNKKTLLILALTFFSVVGNASTDIIQFGKMREALAEGKTEARIELSELTKKPHFYGVGALAGLKGEVAVIDGEVITTQAATSAVIDKNPITTPANATYLVGGYIPTWQSTATTTNLSAKELEKLIEQTAAQKGLAKQKPFVFMVQGKVETADMHVIRGACPMHARMKKIELPASQKPFEAKLKLNDVIIVGVFAKDRVGDLTHPATSIQD